MGKVRRKRQAARKRALEADSKRPLLLTTADAIINDPRRGHGRGFEEGAHVPGSNLRKIDR